MSDPVTHAEIEDVLSSIRRLVSDDPRPQPAAPEPAARLVLTPALRVQEAEPADSTALEAGAAPDTGPYTGAYTGPDAAPDTSTGAPQGAETPSIAADLPEPDLQNTAEPSGTPDVSDAIAEDPPIAFRHRTAHEVETPAEQTEPERDGPPEDQQQHPAAEAGAELEAADAPWADPKATLYAAAADAAWADETSEGPETDAPAAAPPVAPPEAVTAGARAASVVRKIAELEARGARAEDTVQQHWEPDSQTEAPFAGAGPDTIEWRDAPLAARRPALDSAAEADAAARDEGGASAAVSSAEIPAGAEEEAAETVVEAAFTGAALETLAEAGETYLDEDSLRDLVASIVREELQGPLGERITRNVRKLVRREIHRALAAHDLL